MDDDIRQLASLRIEVNALEAELVEAEAALTISPLVVKCAQLKKRVFDMVILRGDLEDAIYGAALQAYRSTGNTCPHLAVHVQTSTNHGFLTRPYVHIDSDLSDYLAKEEEGA